MDIISNCPLNSCLCTHRLMLLSSLILEISSCSEIEANTETHIWPKHLSSAQSQVGHWHYTQAHMPWLKYHDGERSWKIFSLPLPWCSWRTLGIYIWTKAKQVEQECYKDDFVSCSVHCAAVSEVSGSLQLASHAILASGFHWISLLQCCNLLPTFPVPEKYLRK